MVEKQWERMQFGLVFDNVLWSKPLVSLDVETTQRAIVADEDGILMEQLRVVST